MRLAAPLADSAVGRVRVALPHFVLSVAEVRDRSLAYALACAQPILPIDVLWAIDPDQGTSNKGRLVWVTGIRMAHERSAAHR
jgi:hypothetical protein